MKSNQYYKSGVYSFLGLLIAIIGLVLVKIMPDDSSMRTVPYICVGIISKRNVRVKLIRYND